MTSALQLARAHEIAVGCRRGEGEEEGEDGQQRHGSQNSGSAEEAGSAEGSEEMKRVGVTEGPASQPMAAYKAAGSQRGPRRVQWGRAMRLASRKSGPTAALCCETKRRRWRRSGRRRMCALSGSRQRRRRSALAINLAQGPGRARRNAARGQARSSRNTWAARASRKRHGRDDASGAWLMMRCSSQTRPELRRRTRGDGEAGRRRMRAQRGERGARRRGGVAARMAVVVMQARAWDG